MLLPIFLLIQFIIGVSSAYETPHTLLPVTYEKYITYNWNIQTCNGNSSLVIMKNNMTYLNIPVKYKYYGEPPITIPWCAITYGTHNVYEWYVTYYDCNETDIKTKFNVNKINMYYATNELNKYKYTAADTYYAIIEVPHFKNSLEKSCLNMEIDVQTWRSENFPAIKIHNDIDTCRYNYLSDSFYTPKFTHTSDYSFTSNMTIGCTYPDQTGSFDIVPGKKYIIEHYVTYNWDRIIELTMQINSYVQPNAYYLPAIVFGSILAIILGIGILICMYIVYIKTCRKDPTFEIVYDQDLHNVL